LLVSILAAWLVGGIVALLGIWLLGRKDRKKDAEEREK
jgi:hypothetical protein